MSVKQRFGNLLREYLPAQGISPHVCIAIVHHLSQHLATMVTGPGAVVYHLSIEGVASEEHKYGRGVFMGPLRASTPVEKDMILAALLGMPKDPRARLDSYSGVLVVVNAKDDKSTYATLIELSIPTTLLCVCQNEQACHFSI